MSGILALFHRNKCSASKAQLENMASVILHRAVDGVNYWANGEIALGQCLFITNNENNEEAVLLEDPESGLVIAADARLYNRQEMIGHLKPHLKNRNVSDNEIILRAYQRWGTACCDYLTGDYAFVIADTGNHRIFCSRDHFGVRPLYYYLSTELLVIASEPQAILRVKGVPHELNRGRIADYLVTQLEGINKTETFYRDVKRLPPAHWLLVGHENTESRQYWLPCPDSHIHFDSDEEYIEAFEDVLTQAIDDRLCACDRIMALQSGGIDSSCIVAIARKLSKEHGYNEISIISALADTSVNSITESNYIRQFHDYIGGSRHTITLNDALLFEREFFGIIDNLVEPFDDMLVIFQMYHFAKQNGCRVLIDGLDGDMLFSLPARYPANLIRQGKLFTAIREVNGLWEHLYNKKQNRLRLLGRNLRQSLVPNKLRIWRRKHINKRQPLSGYCGTIINPEFANEIEIGARLKEFDSHTQSDFSHSLSELHASTLQHPFLTVGVERYERIAAQSGVEACHPFLDKRLVELDLSFPWQQKVRDGQSKYVLRRVAEKYIPDTIAWRSGTEHVGWDYTRNFITRNMDVINDALCSPKSDITEFVDSKRLSAIQGKHPATLSNNEANLLFECYVLSRWLSRHNPLSRLSGR